MTERTNGGILEAMRTRPSRSKSQILRDHLLNELTEYRIPIGAKLPTEAQLMNQFSVSRGTVQRVLADLSAEGFLERQQGRGTFRVGPQRKPRASERTMLIGVWFNMPSGPLFGPVREGIRRELDHWGYHGVFEEGGMDVGAEGRGIASLVQKPLDGFIVAPSVSPDDDHQPLAELIERSVPIVMVDRQLPRHPTDLVTTHNELGAEALVNHLIDLGHRRIGFVGVSGFETIDERWRGYRLAMQRHGLEVNEAWVRVNEATAYDCGREAMREMLRLATDQRPTAVFGANDVIAETCAIVARERRFQLPKDLSIVGFDDINPLPDRPVWLTTYAQPKELMGQQAVRLLMKRIQDPSRQTATVMLEGKLIVRESTAPPPS